MAGRRRVFRWVALAFDLLMLGLLVTGLALKPRAESGYPCDERLLSWELGIIFPVVAAWLLGDLVLTVVGWSRRGTRERSGDG